jgi:CMP-N,N'-diacetyllegionaminic acid synthase
MSATAVILARRGSKGVPGKNMAPIAGRPCLAWTIDAALAASSVSNVIVSTDWPEAAALAQRMNATVVDRPDSLAGDDASVDAAARHALEARGDTMGPVVILYANVPVRPHGLVDRAAELLRLSGADSVQSYAPVGKHHPWWTCRVDAASGRVAPWAGEQLFHGVYRRQSLPPAYIPDGGVMVVSSDALFLRLPAVPAGPHAFLGRETHRRAIINEEGAVVDIDSPIDVCVADAVLRAASERPEEDRGAPHALAAPGARA